jgi:hypothetical protein
MRDGTAPVLSSRAALREACSAIEDNAPRILQVDKTRSTLFMFRMFGQLAT